MPITRPNVFPAMQRKAGDELDNPEDDQDPAQRVEVVEYEPRVVNEDVGVVKGADAVDDVDDAHKQQHDACENHTSSTSHLLLLSIGSARCPAIASRWQGEAFAPTLNQKFRRESHPKRVIAKFHPETRVDADKRGCRRRDSNPRHADYDSAALWLWNRLFRRGMGHGWGRKSEVSEWRGPSKLRCSSPPRPVRSRSS